MLCCCVVVSVPCSLVVTCWERDDLLAVVYVVFSCILSLSQMCPGPHQKYGRGWCSETGLSPPVKWFYRPFQGGTFLWIICVIHVLCLSCFGVCSLLPFGHLLGKGWPLGSQLWCFCPFPMWYPGTGVVLDCIDLIFATFLTLLIIVTLSWHSDQIFLKQIITIKIRRREFNPEEPRKKMHLKSSAANNCLTLLTN